MGAPDQDTARAIEGLHVIKAGSHASGSGTSLVAGGVQPLDPVHPAGAEVELHGVRIGVGVQVGYPRTFSCSNSSAGGWS